MHSSMLNQIFLQGCLLPSLNGHDVVLEASFLHDVFDSNLYFMQVFDFHELLALCCSSRIVPVTRAFCVTLPFAFITLLSTGILI